MSERTNKAMKLAEESIMLGCCIVRPTIYWVVGVKDMGEGFDPWKSLPPLHAIQYHKDYENDVEGPWGTLTFEENNFKHPICVHTQTEGEMIIADYNGEVWYWGLNNNKDWEENGIPQRGIKGLKNIHGIIYAVGIDRAVFRREGNDKWTHLSKELESQTEKLKKQIGKKGGQLWTGFECIDGFEAKKDLYAAGGNGDVWRYDGKDWAPIDIPLPKMQIRKICCAEDGFVYITGRFGVLLKGREDSWEIIKHEHDHEDLNDVEYYKGKVYVATSYRLYEVAGKQTRLVKFNLDEVPVNHGHLYVNHGLLMTAGRSSAAIYDGEQWKVLYGGSKLDAATDAYISGKVLLETEDLLDAIGDQLDEMSKNKK